MLSSLAWLASIPLCPPWRLFLGLGIVTGFGNPSRTVVLESQKHDPSRCPSWWAPSHAHGLLSCGTHSSLGHLSCQPVGHPTVFRLFFEVTFQNRGPFFQTLFELRVDSQKVPFPAHTNFHFTARRRQRVGYLIDFLQGSGSSFNEFSCSVHAACVSPQVTLQDPLDDPSLALCPVLSWQDAQEAQ